MDNQTLFCIAFVCIIVILVIQWFRNQRVEFELTKIKNRLSLLDGIREWN